MPEETQMQPEVSYGDATQSVILDVAWEIRLNAPVETVWQKLVHEVDSWWAHCYKPGSTVLIEPIPGGRFWERFADGVSGGVYANVVYVEPPYVLKCMGNWAMPGIGMSSGVWRLSEQEGGTLVKATGQLSGNLDPKLMKERRGGTQSLITALQRWVEHNERVIRD
jgi:uncharacterized protein YndB with AHSA1/START domain